MTGSTNPSAAAPAYGRLADEIDRTIYRVNRLASKFTWVHISLRLVLIILSSTVAAQKNLVGSPIQAVVPWVPVLALAVAILTALDTWMKPGEKWKTHDRFDDEFKTIRRELSYMEPTDIAAVKKIDEAYNVALAEHRKEALF
jgi:hypothetical protein